MTFRSLRPYGPIVRAGHARGALFGPCRSAPDAPPVAGPVTFFRRVSPVFPAGSVSRIPFRGFRRGMRLHLPTRRELKPGGTPDGQTPRKRVSRRSVRSGPCGAVYLQALRMMVSVSSGESL